jgi:hypothetical protein
VEKTGMDEGVRKAALLLFVRRVVQARRVVVALRVPRNIHDVVMKR